MSGFYQDGGDDLGDFVCLPVDAVAEMVRGVVREELERMAKRRLLYPPTPPAAEPTRAERRSRFASGVARFEDRQLGIFED